MKIEERDGIIQYLMQLHKKVNILQMNFKDAIDTIDALKLDFKDTIETIDTFKIIMINTEIDKIEEKKKRRWWW